MKIIYNPQISKLYDFVSAIMLFTNNYEFEKFFENSDLTPTQVITDSIHYIWNQLDRNTPGLALLFIKIHGKPSYIESTYYKYLQEIITIENFLDSLFTTSIDELQIKVLEFYDESNKDARYYKELLESPEKLYLFINSLNISQQQKWELMGIVNKPEEILLPLKSFCTTIQKRLNKVYKDHSGYIANFEKIMLKKINKDGEYLINTELKALSDNFFPNENRDIMITCSFICEFSKFTTLNKSYRTIYLGINYEKSLSFLNGKTDVFKRENFFKAFADKNRLKIIKMLLEKEMYVGEIAKECGLSISTVSYHLDIIHLGGLVGRSVKHKKVYYIIQKKYISLLLEQLLKITNTKTTIK